VRRWVHRWRRPWHPDHRQRAEIANLKFEIRKGRLRRWRGDAFFVKSAFFGSGEDIPITRCCLKRSGLEPDVCVLWVFENAVRLSAADFANAGLWLGFVRGDDVPCIGDRARTGPA